MYLLGGYIIPTVYDDFTTLYETIRKMDDMWRDTRPI